MNFSNKLTNKYKSYNYLRKASYYLNKKYIVIPAY